MYAEAAIKAGKHVFVEKPHAIDPVGVRRMAAVCDLAKKKGLSILSGLQSRFDKRLAGDRQADPRRRDRRRRRHAVDVPARPLSARTAQPERDAKSQYQFRNWYHFLWLSGDDVPQSLVHNIDRMCWIMKEEMPKWAFGLGGRSASFGEVYGDMFDHHTVVYEYKNGTRLYALCRTQANALRQRGDIIMGTKGQCDLAELPDQRRNQLAFEGQRNNPYQAEQTALIEAVENDKPINSGYHMVNSTMIGVMGQIACYTGQPVQLRRSHARRTCSSGRRRTRRISKRRRRPCRTRPGTTRCRCRESRNCCRLDAG